jgi:hypothetical protein
MREVVAVVDRPKQSRTKRMSFFRGSEDDAAESRGNTTNGNQHKSQHRIQRRHGLSTECLWRYRCPHARFGNRRSFHEEPIFISALLPYAVRTLGRSK